MPRHLISDAHEWINEIPTVPIYYLAKPQPRERAWQNQRGKKTLSNLSGVYSGRPTATASPAAINCRRLRARQPGTGKPKGCHRSLWRSRGEPPSEVAVTRGKVSVLPLRQGLWYVLSLAKARPRAEHLQCKALVCEPLAGPPVQAPHELKG